MDPRADPAGLLPLARGRYDGFVAALATIVDMDTGSLQADDVNVLAGHVETRLRGTGWDVERLSAPTVAGFGRLGDVVVGRRHGSRPRDAGGRSLLLMAHMDTVFDPGTTAARPFRIDGDRAYGPGVCDDKAGLICGIEAVELLCDDARFDDFAEITLLCNPDEEIGSPASRALLQRLAGEADVAIGLEAARRNGDLVTARKGMTDMVIDITGRASHAGVAPELGVNAALEAAHKTVALQALNERWDGVTVNVGVLRAGSRSNVVPAGARLEVDVRAVTVADFDRAVAAVEAIATTSFVPGTSSTFRPSHTHVPMERTKANAALVAEAGVVADALGFTIGDQATGGCGDANIAAATGTPTIDGFGPIGAGAHGLDEWLDLGSIVPRTALLAGFLARLGTRE